MDRKSHTVCVGGLLLGMVMAVTRSLHSQGRFDEASTFLDHFYRRVYEMQPRCMMTRLLAVDEMLAGNSETLANARAGLDRAFDKVAHCISDPDSMIKIF